MTSLLRSSQDFPRIFKLTEKVTLVNDDLFIIEDSADSNKRKKVKSLNVGGAGGGTLDHALLTSNLAWTTSLHTGTADTLAKFDSLGDADNIPHDSGTWSPVLTFGGGNVGMTAFLGGEWERFGQIIAITCDGFVSNKGSSTGGAQVSGLPFTIKDAFGASAVFPTAFFDITFTDMTAALGAAGSTTIDLFNLLSTGAGTFLTHANFLPFASFSFGGTYITDDA